MLNFIKEGNSGKMPGPAGSELIDHCSRLHSRAMKLLVMEARLMKVSLPELMGRISTALAREKAGAWQNEGEQANG